MALRGIFSYWQLPVLSSLVWLGMLLGMLIWWNVDAHRRKLPSMNAGQTIAYISDVGAFDLKPLFIPGCCVVTITLDLSFVAERWLRHRGRLVPNGSVGEKALAALSIFFAMLGTAGLVLLSIFDTYHHPSVHRLMLLLFMGGYLISAVFSCWEYQRLGIKHREYRVLRISFWIKLFFILVEVALAIAFGVLLYTRRDNPGAILEWTISFIFTFYILSFVFDLYPAVHTRAHEARYSKHTHHDMEEARIGRTPVDGPANV